MAAQVEWLVAIVVILVALLIVAFLWELARRIYYWTAARVYGLQRKNSCEKPPRTRGCESGTPSKAERGTYTELRPQTHGAFICAAAVGALCLPLDPPWWHTALIAGAVYVGIHMAVGTRLF